MARKNLLQGLMDQAKSEPPAPEEPQQRAPRYAKGAIGAVSQSIADLKSRSVVELDPNTIIEGGLSDRVEHDEAEHATLMESIRTYGQQVPVLVRPDPQDSERYRIVYGRRRVLALRDLGLPVKAMIRDLDDREAILAQGQENSARRDLSFIEKANFARQMVEAGYDRKIIADALTTDKTLISRLLQVAESVPVEIIEHIGAAPSVGRDRWLSFATRWTEQEIQPDQGIEMLDVYACDKSDDRFDALFAWLEKREKQLKGGKPVPLADSPPAPAAEKRALTRPDGKRLGQITRKGDKLRIDLTGKSAQGFDTWLEDNIERLHRDWLANRDEDGRS
ncbi:MULTISPECIES: plasmid partitioning protein RepB [unclassified Mameliella]|uniref:plasmid partitioning protein RepB n=1 Tax=unclassified Mameliella TaxID=2630630 RepID=UPI00273F263D|nr:MULTISPECIES: plasmid partitioning protein RepB [unclassified Mameliella]